MFTRTTIAKWLLAVVCCASSALNAWGCDCAADRTVHSGRFCVTNGWTGTRSVTSLQPIAVVNSELVSVDYELAGATYRVEYRVASSETRSGSCPDQRQVFKLERKRLLRAGGGDIPEDENAFWTQQAELEAAADSGGNILTLDKASYVLSAGEFCRSVARDAGEFGEDGGEPLVCPPSSAAPLSSSVITSK